MWHVGLFFLTAILPAGPVSPPAAPAPARPVLLAADVAGDPVQELTASGDGLMQAGKAQEAMFVYLRAVQLAPDRPGLRWRVAQASAQTGDAATGLAAMAAMARLSPPAAGDPEFRALKMRLEALAAATPAAARAATPSASGAATPPLSAMRARLRACREALRARGAAGTATDPAFVEAVRCLPRGAFDKEEP
jgi:hypothetical protein